MFVSSNQQVVLFHTFINTMYKGISLYNNIQNDWDRIRQDLNVLANAYNYNNNNRNNRNNRRNRQGNNGDWRNNIPFPLPF